MEGRRAYQWSKYDAIAAVVAALMVRIKDDDKLRRFYDHRGAPTGSRASNNYWSIFCARRRVGRWFTRAVT